MYIGRLQNVQLQNNKNGTTEYMSFYEKKGDVVGIIKRPRHQQKTHNIDGLLIFQHNVYFSIYILKPSHKLYALYWFSYFIAVHNNAESSFGWLSN